MFILLAVSLVYGQSLDFIPSTLKYPEKRWQSSMTYCPFSDTLYIYSGFTVNGLSKSFDMYNLTSNTWTSIETSSYKSPYLRSSAIFFKHHFQSIYLVAGLTDYGPMNDIWRYSIDLDLVFYI